MLFLTKVFHDLVLNSKEILSKSNIYLILFVLFCVITLFTIKYSNFYVNIFVRSLRYLFLFLYYSSLVKKKHPLIVSVICVFFLASAFLSFNSSSITGLLLICLSRILLARYVIINVKFKNINWGTFSLITCLFIIVGLLVLSLYYNNSPVFYVTVISVILLIVLLSVSFLSLLNSTKKWNLKFFSAISLFVISDAIFGVQRLSEVSVAFLIMASMFYNLAYYLIVNSDVEKQKLH